MKLNVLQKTSEYRGDHAADVAIAISAEPSMTIHELLERCYGYGESFPNKERHGSRYYEMLRDHIEIRVVAEPAEVIVP